MGRHHGINMEVQLVLDYYGYLTNKHAQIYLSLDFICRR